MTMMTTALLDASRRRNARRTRETDANATRRRTRARRGATRRDVGVEMVGRVESSSSRHRTAIEIHDSSSSREIVGRSSVGVKTRARVVVLFVLFVLAAGSIEGARAQSTPTYETVPANGTSTTERALGNDEYAYFQFSLSAKNDVDVDLDVLDGDADLYVLRPCVDAEDCERTPSDTTYNYQSVHGHGRDEVFIRGDDLDESVDVGTNGTTKYFRVAVHGWSAHGSTFKLAVTEVSTGRALNAAQATALDGIFDKCCTATTSCGSWKTNRANSIDPCHSGFARCDVNNATTMLDLSAQNMACALDASDVAAFGSSLRRLWLRSNGDSFTLATNETSIDILNALPTLESLDVSFVDLGGVDASALCAHFNLKSIEAISSNVTGVFPSCLVNKQNLQVVYLPGNNMMGTLPALNSTTLRTLDVRLQQSTESIAGTIPPSYVSASSKLEHLMLTGLKLSGSIPPFAATSRLRWVYLSHNNLTGPIPLSLGDVANATHVALNHNALSGEVPAGVYDNPNRNEVLLNSNALTKLSVVSAHVTPGASLVTLNASDNVIRDEGIPLVLTSMPKLENLYLRDNEFYGQILDNSTSPAWALYEFDASGNFFTGDIPGASHWGNIFQNSANRARSFDVSQNNYTASPAWLNEYVDAAGLTVRQTVGGVNDPIANESPTITSSKGGISKFMLAVVLLGVSGLTVTGVVLGVVSHRKKKSGDGARRYVHFSNNAIDVEMASRGYR